MASWTNLVLCLSVCLFTFPCHSHNSFDLDPVLTKFSGNKRTISRMVRLKSKFSTPALRGDSYLLVNSRTPWTDFLWNCQGTCGLYPRLLTIYLQTGLLKYKRKAKNGKLRETSDIGVLRGRNFFLFSAKNHYIFRFGKRSTLWKYAQKISWKTMTK